MRLKLMPMLVGAIALTLAAAPFAVNAQTSTPASQRLLLAEGRGQGAWEQLNLTQEQKDQLAQIREQTRSQMEAILTPEQRQQLEALRQNNQGRRAGFRSLNLTEEQQAQMRQIRESSKSQMQAVLTPGQQQQLEQLRQQWRQQRQQRQQQNQ